MVNAKMGERPERKCNYRSGPTRSEIEFHSKLDIARVDRSSYRSKVAGANGEGCVAKTAQDEVCSVEHIKEVRLEYKVHAFPRQFEVLAQGNVRYEKVWTDDTANAAGTWICGRGVGKSGGVKPVGSTRGRHRDGLGRG